MQHLPVGALLKRAYEGTHKFAVEACHIGGDAAEQLGAFAARRCGKSCLVISDTHTHPVGKPALVALQDAGKIVTEHVFAGAHLDATEELGDEVATLGANADFFVAVGSGTLCDLAKHAGHKLSKPVLSYATAASMNGYTSGITAIKVRGLKRTVPCTPALGVFADPAAVATAPPRMAAAGVADYLSKCSAGADWRVANFLRGEYYDENALQFYEGALERVLETAALVGAGDPEAIAVALEALLLSGLSMLVAGSSAPASGGEHLISHFIDMKQAIYGTPNDLHGVQVGVATVHCLGLWERVLALDAKTIDPDALAAAQPSDDTIVKWAIEDWGETIGKEVIAQWRQKARSRNAMRDEIVKFRDNIDSIRAAVQKDLLPASTVAAAIRAAGGPTTPEGMTAPLETYEAALKRARYIRNRFTILDLAAELGVS
ncbi:MAG TPA: iron-containing alcohol dehydrogenase [Candidatus Hydrogenedentes bacterium]|nr:iron-containing alcohol dehydrogenase [Candidatus Hydrogenedentota bacterium]HRK34357.1 iron-containing alcohol dehydrogenase [Candidatus Hydrogenedentota bacterium]